jgi:apolipoprotein D and lipocalin family protein
MIKSILAAISFLIVSTPSFSLDTVPYVDLERYLGTWYEIASYPAFFQRGCVATKATYSDREDGKIDVLNECRKNTLDGKLKKAQGVATVVDTNSNAKLKVRFFVFSGDYWIIDLDRDYQFAVVSAPSMKYLWILSRTKQMDTVTYQGILSRLEEKGFDLTNLRLTPQPLP